MQALSNFDTPLASLYIIHGEEDLLRIEELDRLRHIAKMQGFSERESITVDQHFDWSEILLSIDSPTLFADKKLLEIHIPSGKPGRTGSDALVELAEKSHPDTTVIVFLPKLDASQKKAKWFAHLSKAGIVFDAKTVSAADLPSWIERRLQQFGLTIEREALAVFAERVEGNLLAARQEIEKLSLLHPEGSCLSMADAVNAVANVARFDVFQLSSAWLSGDVLRTTRLVDGLAEEGGEPILLLWSVAEDIRILLRLQAGLKQGQTIYQLRNPLRLWGDKQVLAPKALKRIGTRRLLEALQNCALADRQIKGVENGEAWKTVREILVNLSKC